MTTPPIRTLTLYKQGIGYFGRQGATGDSVVVLTLPREATNDVLKSLTVADAAGGRVLSIDYETPENKAALLKEQRIALHDRASLIDLLTGLRGSQVELHLEAGSVQGRIVGVEASLDQQVQTPLALLVTGGEVQTVAVNRVRGFTLHDERAAQDVHYFLDVSQTEQTRTTLRVQLSEGQHDLAIHYVAPSPTWRMSYRLLLTGEDAAQLIGFGVFDNTLDEDLENVSLTLISGRPVSFEYKLYEGHVPLRPEVSDDPASLEKLGSDPLVRESVSVLAHEIRSPLTYLIGYADLLESDAGQLDTKQREYVQHIHQGINRLSENLNNLLNVVQMRERDTISHMPVFRSGPLGDLKVSGSYFLPVLTHSAEPENLIYPVRTPVSVRRGHSAMVPLIEAAVTFRNLCVFNGAKMPNHPLRVWRLVNTTGVALEQGPVTLSDGARYLGEGIIRFSGLGDDIQIAYALEFGILVSQDVQTLPRTLTEVAFDAGKRRVELTYAVITEQRLTLNSRIGRDEEVLIEQRDPARGEFYQMPAPADTNEGHTRWAVRVPAGGNAEFTLRERQFSTDQVDPTALKSEAITDLLASGIVPERQAGLMRRLVEEKNQNKRTTDQIAGLNTELQELLTRQEQLRKNLQALGGSEREAAVRNRILDDLETSEDRRRAVERSLADLAQALRDNQAAQAASVEALFG